MSIVISNVANVLASIGVIASLVFAAYQARILAHQTKISNGIASLGAMYNGLERLHSIQALLIEDPALRPYFYSNKVAPPAETAEGSRIAVVAEVLADAVDYGLMVVDLMPPVKDYEGWRNFANFLHGNSPVLRQLVSDHPEWWIRLDRHWKDAGGSLHVPNSSPIRDQETAEHVIEASTN
ncbi:hypothetical protein ACQP2P_41010 [Dactylosporangium sp. CA-139114]|uniref:hypothetical protein n=1 Tax=Dactylosporangium sp. CA-139114 TaxID=3239931 RepID=UPI003D994630